MNEVIIADAGLEDLDGLLSHRRPDVQVTLVSATDDGHAVLAAALAARPSVLHLVAHGEPGRVLLGAQPLDARSLLDRSWPDARGTEIHLHACHAGAGAEGRLLLDRLAAATGAAVAASSGPVGPAARGASWKLDVRTAPVFTPSPFAGVEGAGARGWAHELAVTGTPTDGNDTLTSDDAADNIAGGAGNDILIGNGGNDTLIGGIGHDTMDGGAGADVFDGGDGFDVVTYENATSGMVIDIGNPANSTGDAAGDTFTGIERWIGSNYADTMVAGNDPVWFWGHAGDDVEIGGAGNDTMESGDGNDTVYGGAGDDQIYSRADNDVLYGEDGNDLIYGGWGNDMLDGGAGNDTLFGEGDADTINGGDGDDSLDGGQGNDLMNGGAGNDTLIGGIGHDTMEGGAGADVFDGGDGFDEVTYANATSGVVLDLRNPANSTGDAAGDTFTNIERWIGSEFDDRLVGNDDGVWFWGHGGNDVEIGGAGNDTMESGIGNDTIYGGGGDDRAFGRADDDMLYGEAGNDLLAGGGGNDMLDGGTGNDTLIGDWGVDTMIGGDGDDVFYSGAHDPLPEADIIQGGAGNDTFIIAAQSDAGTVSYDGGDGTDTLRISSDNVADPENKITTATPQIDISGMTLTSVERLELVGSVRHTVTMTAAQANGFASITGATGGDVFSITGTAMAGAVTAGNGSQLGAGQAQAETVNGVTYLRIGTDATAGADVTLRFAGGFTADQFQVSGSGITLSGTPSNPPTTEPPTTTPPTTEPPTTTPPTTEPPTTTPPVDDRPSTAMQRIVDGVTEDVKAYAYEGPVSTLQWTFLGDSRGEVLGGSDGNDFLNLLGGDDAAAGGAGDDVLDGGSGSNWLIGGSGKDTFFVDGRGTEVTWSTVTDLEQGEWSTLWGYKEGTSTLRWEEMDGAEGYKGATVHCDIDGNGTIDASMTFAGKSVGAMTMTTGTMGDQNYIAFISL
ncbi:calcium-binding-like protein (plasmid) [Azospirillum sp. TSH58]|uniref:DUF4347 domain-containing protein n=2 Tax=Azospirillum sp. TSH58 TaxID=664962 RepID=UPI000D6025B2|nr:DUF4347 domain-containing protein [Azospirillum sp. TSH58]AWJ85471.1 calcium-binding-like protein [Azospirillum sp. TSH58]